MLKIENKKLFLFKTTLIWFCECPEKIRSFGAVTYRQCKNKVDLPGFERSEFSTLIIDLEKEIDELWSGISSKNCRYKINRAKREGVTVEVSSDYEGFSDRYNRFAVDKGIESCGISVEEMEQFCDLIVAIYDGKVISSQLYIKDNAYTRLLLACSDRFNDLNKVAGYANRLLFWEAMLYSKNIGVKAFDFGGYYTGEKPDPGKSRINSAKKEFGGKLAIQYNYTKIDSSVYQLLKAVYKLF